MDISEDGIVTAKSWEQMPDGASRAVMQVKEVRRAVASGQGGKGIILECRLAYKFYDKIKALELLGNHLGMWKNRHEVLWPDTDTFELPKLALPDEDK